MEWFAIRISRIANSILDSLVAICCLVYAKIFKTLSENYIVVKRIMFSLSQLLI